MRSKELTIANMELATNSGVPFFSRRRNTIQADLEISKTSNLLPAILGWRGQEGGPHPIDVKQRVIWMMPASHHIREGQVYQVLINWLKANRKIAGYVGPDFVDARITYLFDRKDTDQLVISTDFTKYDQHFNKTLQNIARSVIEIAFGRSHVIVEWGKRIFP